MQSWSAVNVRVPAALKAAVMEALDDPAYEGVPLVAVVEWGLSRFLAERPAPGDMRRDRSGRPRKEES